MITDPVLLGGYTAIFGVSALYFAWRAVRARRYAVDVTEHVLHVAMAVVMVAMVWPVWESWPRAPQLALFVAATLWFVLMLVLQLTGVAAAGRHGRWGLWYRSAHAAMMAAMVWMIAVMVPADLDAGHGDMAGQVGAGHTDTADHAGHADMAHHAAHATDHVALSTPAQVSGWIFVVLLGALGVIELVMLMRRTGEMQAARLPLEAPEAPEAPRFDGDQIIRAHPDSFAPHHAMAESVGVAAMLLGMAAMCLTML